MRVIVLGGHGHLGARALDAIRRLPESRGHEVVVAGRKGPLRLDLSDPSTFPVLVRGDVVVDVADSTAAPPHALARHCLENGVVLFEASSDAAVIERLLADLEGVSGDGAVVLGAGIFTGLSNLLAARAAKDVEANREANGGCRRLVLGISTSPFSAAGGSTVRLMGAALAVRARSWVEGRRRLSPPIGPGPTLPFPSRPRPTLSMALGEPDMLHRSLGVPDVAVFLALRPALLRSVFLLLPRFVVQSAIFAWLTRLTFAFVRRVLLARTRTTVELVAVAESDDGVTVRRSLTADDGMRAGGAAIAAIVALATLASAKRPRGLKMVDEVVALDDILPKIQSLGEIVRET